MTTRKQSASDPTPDQTLPEEQPEDQPVEPNQDLPDTEPIDESPADEKGERGKSAEAHANAPGQQKKDRVDPNTYQDPENPPHTP